MSLRIYIFLWLSLLSIASAIVLTAVESHRLEQLLIDEGDEEHRFAVSAFSAQVEQEVDAQIRVQRAIAHSIEARLASAADGTGGDVANLPRAELAQLAAQYRSAAVLDNVYIGDAHATSVLYDPPTGPDGRAIPPTSYSDRDYVQAMLATGDTAISGVHVGRRFAVVSVHIATPIWTRDHRFAGYVACTLDVEQFQAIADRIAALLPDASVLLLDKRHEVIASSGSKRYPRSQDLSQTALLIADVADPTTREGKDPDGVPVHAGIAVTRAFPRGWTAIVARPSSLLDDRVRAAQLHALLVGGLVLGVALCVAFVLAGWMARPIARLARVAGAIGNGDFAQHPPQLGVWSPTEIRALSVAIGEMVDKLQAYTVEREHKLAELSTGNASLTESLAALRQTQDQLLQAGRLAAVGQLAGGIAHDFNNLLTVIMNSAHFLHDGATDRPGDRADAQEIIGAAARGAKLTRQLLAFSRRQVLMPKAVDLNTILVDMQSMLLRIIGEHVRLTVTACREPAIAMVDPGQFEQVLVNLVVNARDALPGGGAIQVTLTRETIPAAGAREAWLVLSVADDGVGMTEEIRAQVFEPFFTTKAPDKGTGLGLSTVYGIVKQSGGDITVSSTPGHGTTFRVLLPAVAGEALAEPARAASPASPAAARILVVDDEPALRLIVARALASAGHQVDVASTPTEALALAATAGVRFDLLLTDVVMPDMSGPELAARFAQQHPETLVLFMSGYAPDAMGAGTDRHHFLPKPFLPSTLLATVRVLLDGQRRAAG
ncbi:MAG: response regulator [Deltaproteobacteria bacterium]|nr:response regulator [Deltaproteobacteria bacterium]